MRRRMTSKVTATAYASVSVLASEVSINEFRKANYDDDDESAERLNFR